MVPEHDKIPIPSLWLLTHGWLAAPPDHSCDVPADFPQSHPAASSPHHHGVSSTAPGPQASSGAGPWPTLHESNPAAPAKLSIAPAAALWPQSIQPPQLPHPALAARAALPPVFPRQPLSPVPPGLPLEAWTKRDEVDLIRK